MSLQPHPEILSVDQLSAHSVRISLRVDRQSVFFDGHFAEHPILPGVAQIHWAEHYARAYISALPPAARFAKMEAIKFQDMIKPEQRATLALSYQPDTRKLSFSYAAGDTTFSSGRLVYSDAAEQSR